MSTDAIVLLREDHKEIRRLFRQFQAAGKDAKAEQRRVSRKIIEALTVHTYLENETMYPEVRRLLPISRTTCWSPTRNIMWPTC